MDDVHVFPFTFRRLARFVCALLTASVVTGPATVTAQEAAPISTASIGDRERLLLERIEQMERRFDARERELLDRNTELERRIADLERRIGALPTTNTSASASANRIAVPGPARTETGTTASATSGSNSAQNGQAAEADAVSFRPYGFLVANAAYNTYALVPGNISFFANPTVTGITARQFSLSAGNTLLGTDILLPKVGNWTLNGKFDFNLRGPRPVTEDNVFAPYFANVYIEAKSEPHRIVAGLAADFISPLSPRSLNLYPGSYLPGDLGTNRPQARYEYSRSVRDGLTFLFQGAVATAVQTYQVSEEVRGFGTDVPDGQLRVAIGRGELDPQSRKRPLEAGISGHVGRRSALRLTDFSQREFTTWSANLDLGANLGS
jgi:hypothetical protein